MSENKDKEPFNPNRFDWLVDLANTLNVWRIIPKLFLVVYLYVLYQGSIWYMGLEDPTGPQTTFITGIYGIGAAWLGLYIKSGTKD